MTSSYHFRQPSQKHIFMSRSVDTNYLNSPFSSSVTGALGVENASFDSIRTDLSANSKDVIIGEQWIVLGRIGEGSFGEVFEAEDMNTGRHYAIKREPLDMPHLQLKHESLMYDVLAGGPGIPQCHWHGQHEEFDCLVIDLLGPNLNDLRESVKSISNDTAIDLGCQMVSILEHIHKQGLVYRDVKPDNFLFPANCHLIEPEMIEVPDERGMPHIQYKQPTCEEVFEKWFGDCQSHPKLYVVDFGLMSWWRNPSNDKPYPELKKNIKNKTGTARYASLNVHRGKPHARRDDIESLGYLLLDLIFGTLPWTGIQAKNSRIGWDKMRQIKEDTLTTELCAGLPRGFLEFIEYSRSLKFLDEPDYNLLRRYLRGSAGGGEFSDLVEAPTNDHSERKQVSEVEAEGDHTIPHLDHSRKEHIKPVHHVNTYLPREESYLQQQQQQQQHHHHHHHHHRVPRQRRASYNHPRQYHDDTGVFAMDDLHNTLPQPVEQQRPHTNFFTPQRERGGTGGGFPRFGRGDHQPINNYNNYNNYNSNGCMNFGNRRTSRDFGTRPSNTYHHELNSKPSSSMSSSFQKFGPKNRRRQKKVGWNSHKHQDSPWKPANWEKQKKPDINITSASWGNDQADAAWGDRDNHSRKS